MIKIKYLNKLISLKKEILLIDLIKKIDKNLLKICIGGYIDKKIKTIFYIIKKNISLKLITINDKIGIFIIKNFYLFIIINSIKKIFNNVNIIKIKKKNKYFFIYIKIKKNNILKNKNILEKKIINIIKEKKLIINLIKKNIDKYKKIKNLSIKNKKKYYIYIIYNYIYNILIKKKFLILLKIKKIYNIKKLNINKIHFYLYKYINKNIDHRLINKQIDLYHINKKSPGMIFWHEKGTILINIIKNILRKKLNEYNYLEVKSASLINKEIWKKSGHWENYYKKIFYTKKFCIKPMNCPGHIEIYNQKIRSYKSLPIRFAEFGLCHRNESSGSLYGLMRTRSFIQDDAHIFCTKKQIKSEIYKCIDIIYDIYKIFNFKKIDVFLSTRPKKYIGNKKNWKNAEKKLKEILKKKKNYI